MSNVYFFIVFLTGLACILSIYLFIRKNSNINYKIKKANLYVIYNKTNREKILKEIVKKVSFETFLKKIKKDTLFYKYLTYYDIDQNPHINLISSIKGKDYIDEDTFKKYLSSQNSILRKKALDNLDEYKYLTSFLKECFKNEDNEHLIEMFIDNDIVIDTEILLKKLDIVQTSSVGAKILFSLMNKTKLDVYIKEIEKMNNIKYRVILTSMIYKGKFNENLVEYLRKEEDEDMFSLINTVLSEGDIDDNKLLEEIISITENFWDTRVSFEIGDSQKINTHFDLYNTIFNFQDYNKITKMYVVNKVLSFNNDKITALLISRMAIARDEEYDLFIKDVIYNCDSLYIKRMGIISLKKMGCDISYSFAKYLYYLEDEEIIYNLVYILSRSDNVKNAKLLKKILNKSDDFMKNLICNIIK